VRRAAMAGAGLALLPELACTRELALGTLEAVLPELSARGHPLYLVYNATAHLPRTVALFRDHVLREFPRR
jgi:DNA-binding transcriptional LysR family regulator